MARTRRRAFTLAELLVSVAIMSLLLITVGAIFAMSTKATGLANANNEAMNNLRALEQQLRQDFRGLRRDAFLGLCYNYLPPRLVDPNRPERAAVRSDWIVFFANGDFQTLAQRWDPNSNPPSAGGPNAAPICGNLARIEYGMLGMLDYSTTDTTNSNRPLATVQLGRFAKLMIPDLYPGSLPAQTADNPPLFSAFITNGFTGASVYENWEYEYVTLSDWRNPFVWPATTTAGYPNDQSYATWLVGCYRPGTTPRRNNLWLGLGYIDLNQTLSDHLRMIPGCISFRIQRWAEQDPVTGLPVIPRWWPEDNDNAIANTLTLPSGSANFGPDMTNPAAVATWPGLRIWECFNVPPNIPNPGNAAAAQDWPQAMTDNQAWPWITRDFNRNAADQSDGRRAVKADFPKAIKITVTVLDANRRMLDKVPARSVTLDDTRLNELGAQSFSMIIPLE
ncbi:MAG: PulJ/GspJ family protein [Phycisphaerae bacterium]